LEANTEVKKGKNTDGCVRWQANEHEEKKHVKPGVGAHLREKKNYRAVTKTEPSRDGWGERKGHSDGENGKTKQPPKCANGEKENER